ncbi:MAG TPA: PadR family transcriptional regulator [Thermomicrobiales bacterium]|nr:PadR family transcriptional regulator [Thermomicrobiales bacterium]
MFDRHHRQRHGMGWQGGPPPWDQPAGPHHHRHGDDPWPGPPFGRRFGGFGPHAERFFGRGDLKYVILDLVKEQPRHGYDVIRALEERFRGFYSPSPGSVYPTLQLLEDQGYVTSSQHDGKRVYTITDEGRHFLAEQAEMVERLRARIGAARGAAGRAELHEIFGELRQLGPLMARAGAGGALHDPEKVRRLRDIVARARREIEALFAEGEPAKQEPPPDLL